MKILLDECLPVDFRHNFPGHEAHTVQWAGLKGKKNGELMLAAEAAGYNALLTVDQGLPDQFRAGDRKIAIVLSRTNQIEDLLPLLPAIAEALESVLPGRVAVVSFVD